MGMAVKDPSHGSDAGFIRDLDGNMHVIIEDWSPISANKRGRGIRRWPDTRSAPMESVTSNLQNQRSTIAPSQRAKLGRTNIRTGQRKIQKITKPTSRNSTFTSRSRKLTVIGPRSALVASIICSAITIPLADTKWRFVGSHLRRSTSNSNGVARSVKAIPIPILLSLKASSTSQLR